MSIAVKTPERGFKQLVQFSIVRLLRFVENPSAESWAKLVGQLEGKGQIDRYAPPPSYIYVTMGTLQMLGEIWVASMELATGSSGL